MSYVVADGKSNWLEGVILICQFCVSAVLGSQLPLTQDSRGRLLHQYSRELLVLPRLDVLEHSRELHGRPQTVNGFPTHTHTSLAHFWNIIPYTFSSTYNLTTTYSTRVCSLALKWAPSVDYLT